MILQRMAMFLLKEYRRKEIFPVPYTSVYAHIEYSSEDGYIIIEGIQTYGQFSGPLHF